MPLSDLQEDRRDCLYTLFRAMTDTKSQSYMLSNLWMGHYVAVVHAAAFFIKENNAYPITMTIF